MIPLLQPDELAARYDLLARATCPLPTDEHDRVRHEGLESLRALVNQDLRAMARQGSPDGSIDIYLDFCRELDRFAQFCAYPELSRRALVAFGGRFSAGKSSLINTLIEAKVLPVETDPTTTLPAYVLGGGRDEVLALNQYAQRISLTDEEFTSLTHEESERYGTQIARLLQAAFVVRAKFPWPNLAFIDTPGFHADTVEAQADSARAMAQLSTAQAVVWVRPIKDGTLSEDDLTILAELACLRPDQPRLVVLSRADQVTDSDRDTIVTHVQTQLATRNLATEGVFPVSRHPQYRHLLAPLVEHLERWQGLAQRPRFAHRFKALFVRYQRGLEGERAGLERYHLNRLLTLLPDGDALAEARPLLQAAEAHNARCAKVLEELGTLRQRFFTTLVQVGKAVGVPLPEPHEIELIDIGGQPRLQAVFAALTEDDADRQEPNRRETLLKALAALQQAAVVSNHARLLRRVPTTSAPLAVLQEAAVVSNHDRLVRRVPTTSAPLAVLQEERTPS